ncbi:hypothetical protein BSKO_09684 [Bryopsis sp. KO-2023]|nr:hypothetical protein BSKO_09684 [Bryopsis sp. KO-2023]
MKKKIVGFIALTVGVVAFKRWRKRGGRQNGGVNEVEDVEIDQVAARGLVNAPCDLADELQDQADDVEEIFDKSSADLVLSTGGGPANILCIQLFDLGSCSKDGAGNAAEFWSEIPQGVRDHILEFKAELVVRGPGFSIELSSDIWEVINDQIASMKPNRIASGASLFIQANSSFVVESGYARMASSSSGVRNVGAANVDVEDEILNNFAANILKQAASSPGIALAGVENKDILSLKKIIAPNIVKHTDLAYNKLGVWVESIQTGIYVKISNKLMEEILMGIMGHPGGSQNSFITTFLEHVNELISGGDCIDIVNDFKAAFLPSLSRSEYTFNRRNMSKVLVENMRLEKVGIMRRAAPQFDDYD